jgi:hypothetical protein
MGKFDSLKPRGDIETHADQEVELSELREKAEKHKRGGRPKKDEALKLNVSIKLLLTQNEIDRLKTSSEAKGISVNALIRLLVNENL